MKLMFKAEGHAPDYYVINDNVIVACKNDICTPFDLSDFPIAGLFQGSDNVSGAPAFGNIERHDNGELVVTLIQQVIASQYPEHKAHWRGLVTIEAADYDPNTCYVTPTGMAGIDDYEIVQGVDVAGNTGWTVRKKEVADG
ncbi:MULTISPECIES: hypothetical protein [Halomonas]|uniref:hypothetical protein n=1 Tax=Halomonas TaxID=2745 RepID=UPI001C93CCAD|nr:MULTISPECIES: hypothetical protein [Halomonas]MBY6208770.1 hypothetical protein [Halomonas sp. DP3Y7-2]MBY6227240.1 hypothetical protein [Halomonas sp. DP3Y7-1]MCA0915010.1 hypothetical protein [Halomonas denitrificans]